MGHSPVSGAQGVQYWLSLQNEETMLDNTSPTPNVLKLIKQDHTLELSEVGLDSVLAVRGGAGCIACPWVQRRKIDGQLPLQATAYSELLTIRSP